jgi:hypothetical protein
MILLSVGNIFAPRFEDKLHLSTTSKASIDDSALGWQSLAPRKGDESHGRFLMCLKAPQIRIRAASEKNLAESRFSRYPEARR